MNKLGKLKPWVGIIAGIITIIFIISFFHWMMNNATEVYYEKNFYEMNYTGVLYDVQITDSNLVVVFDDGFYLSFQKPWDKIYNYFPFVDTINAGYSDLILLKNQSVKIRYVHCITFDGSNYFGDVVKGD